jgi:hypothetical protein|tara:strand:- start:92 stop:406 length:315 start_codon:yes stop_codon:yes gene_type:complete
MFGGLELNEYKWVSQDSVDSSEENSMLRHCYDLQKEGYALDGIPGMASIPLKVILPDGRKLGKENLRSLLHELSGKVPEEIFKSFDYLRGYEAHLISNYSNKPV